MTWTGFRALRRFIPSRKRSFLQTLEEELSSGFPKEGILCSAQPRPEEPPSGPSHWAPLHPSPEALAWAGRFHPGQAAQCADGRQYSLRLLAAVLWHCLAQIIRWFVCFAFKRLNKVGRQSQLCALLGFQPGCGSRCAEYYPLCDHGVPPAKQQILVGFNAF